MLKDVMCPVCGSPCPPLDVVDLNKSCQEENGLFLRLSGIAVYYHLCGNCHFCFAPGFAGWSLDAFESNIYNPDYRTVDPDYEKVRPKNSAAQLQRMLAGKQEMIRHLDYGGGNGLLSGLLRQAGWNSHTWDPFVDKTVSIETLGRFNLITAYEVFEHVPDVNGLMANLNLLLADDGIILFTTLFSDGHITANKRLTWWYAAPRNGHISIFSQKSLGLLAQKHNFLFGSFTPATHVLSRQQIPGWASHLIGLPG